jgi:hypothetical protein
VQRLLLVEKKIMIWWVYMTEIVVYSILLWTYKKYWVLYKKILEKKILCFFSILLYLCIFSQWNLISKYEQFLILTDLVISTLLSSTYIIITSNLYSYIQYSLAFMSTCMVFIDWTLHSNMNLITNQVFIHKSYLCKGRFYRWWNLCYQKFEFLMKLIFNMVTVRITL